VGGGKIKIQMGGRVGKGWFGFLWGGGGGE